MKIWLSGSLAADSGFGIAAHEATAKLLKEKGHQVFTPGDVEPWQHEGQRCPGQVTTLGHAQECFLRTRIPALLQCDAVLLPDYWVDDRVVRIERRAALSGGLAIYKGVHEVPRAIDKLTRSGVTIDKGAAEMIAEIKAMEYPERGVDFPNELSEDDEAETPEERRVRMAYERGLSEGEDVFWRKLGMAMVANGHREQCAAVRVAEVATEPLSIMAAKEGVGQFAERMYRHGREFIKRHRHYQDREADASDVLKEMVRYVTGKELQ